LTATRKNQSFPAVIQDEATIQEIDGCIINLQDTVPVTLKTTIHENPEGFICKENIIRLIKLMFLLMSVEL